MRRGATTALAVLVASAALDARGLLGATRTARLDPVALGRGTAEGIAVSSRGRLSRAPALVRLDLPVAAGDPAAGYALSAVTAPDGTTFVGTGPDGAILAVTAKGVVRVEARLGEPFVTALGLDAAGRLLAAGSPGGRIYRKPPGGRPELWVETGEAWILSLLRGRDGAVLAASGVPGRLLSIAGDATVEVLVETEESHMTALEPLGDGELLAASAGEGLVWRIDSEGHAWVVHDGGLAEATAVLSGPQDSVVAAFVDRPPLEPNAPRLRVRLPDGAGLAAADESLADLEAQREERTLEAFLEGLPIPPPRSATRRGAIVRIGADGTVELLWSSESETPFCLRPDPQGRVLFGTGEPARLYRVEADGDVSCLGTLREGQLTRLAGGSDARLVLTSNPVAVYRVSPPAGDGYFVSEPIDAGAPARWGSIRWSTSASPARGVELFARTGNRRRPDETWSAWSPALRDPAGSAVDGPDGRYLQWRLRLAADGDPAAVVTGVEASYEPHNRAPEVQGLRLSPVASAIRAAAEVRVRVRDPDGDPLELRLEVRAVADATWHEAAVEDSLPGTDELAWREGTLHWDATAVAEGEWRLRVVADDQPARAPEQGRSASSELGLAVDRTAPRVAVTSAGAGLLEVRVEDAASPVAGLSVARDGRSRFTPRPLDGVSDSRVETYRFPAPGTTGTWTVRAVDAAGNTTESALAPGAPR